jgi:hypothetical protein
MIVFEATKLIWLHKFCPLLHDATIVQIEQSVAMTYNHFKLEAGGLYSFRVYRANSSTNTAKILLDYQGIYLQFRISWIHTTITNNVTSLEASTT